MSHTSPDRVPELPEVTLTAAGSEKEVNLRRIGAPAILVFHGQDTADAARLVSKVVRARYPRPAEVFIASVIDLRSFPSMFRSMVQPALEKAYHHTAGKLPADADPAELVVLLPDWDGAVHDAVGVKDSPAVAAVAVADREGRIVCLDQSDHLAEAALAALDTLTGPDGT